jgi:hypothetical protein
VSVSGLCPTLEKPNSNNPLADHHTTPPFTLLFSLSTSTHLETSELFYSIFSRNRPLVTITFVVQTSADNRLLVHFSIVVLLCRELLIVPLRSLSRPPSSLSAGLSIPVRATEQGFSPQLVSIFNRFQPNFPALYIGPIIVHLRSTVNSVPFNRHDISHSHSHSDVEKLILLCVENTTMSTAVAPASTAPLPPLDRDNSPKSYPTLAPHSSHTSIERSTELNRTPSHTSISPNDRNSQLTPPEGKRSPKS